MILREYQQRVVDETRRLALLGHRRILIVLPTGAGKTHTAASLVLGSVNKGNKSLALMHRRGLVEQMMQRFGECGIDTGCIMAGKDHELGCLCQVASLWTYVRRMQLDAMEFNKFWIDSPFILIDEAHHVLNKTYQRVLKNYEKSFVIGLTATPTLSTGAGLGNYFDAMVNVVSMNELLDGGHLVPGEYYGPSDPDMSKFKIVQGDYEKKSLDKQFNKPQIIGEVVENWSKYASGKRTMVFAINRKHAKSICKEYIKHGITAEYLDAYSTDDDREGVISRLNGGVTQVVSQVALFTEGTDIPSLECLVIASPTRSLGLHRQILGRGARPFPGKESFMVLDHGGNCRRLGYYEDEIAWSLDGKPNANKPKKKRTKEKHIIDCPMCSSLFTGHVCPKCGHKLKDYDKKIAALDADLVPLKKETGKKNLTTEEKRIAYAMFDYERRRLNKTNKWLLAQYKSYTGVWPRGMDNIGPIEPDKKIKGWLTHQRIKWAKSQQKRALA